MSRAKRVYLVSCVKSKGENTTSAKDLYTSAWFRKARAYIERTGMPWFILSAEHALLHPDDEIGPYEKTLNEMEIRERKQWAERVIGQMEQRLPKVERVVVFAGKKYREHLMDYLQSRALAVEVPLEKHRQGEQLSWFNAQAAQNKVSSGIEVHEGPIIGQELSQFDKSTGRNNDRLDVLVQFYEILEQLEELDAFSSSKPFDRVAERIQRRHG